MKKHLTIHPDNDVVIEYYSYPVKENGKPIITDASSHYGPHTQKVTGISIYVATGPETFRKLHFSKHELEAILKAVVEIESAPETSEFIDA